MKSGSCTADRAAASSDSIQAGAEILLGAQIGPWRVTAQDGTWFEVKHSDGSVRRLRAVDLLDLAEGARRNGHACVLAEAPAAPKPIERIPVYALGNPADQI